MTTSLDRGFRASTKDLAAMTLVEAAAHWFMRHDAGGVSDAEERDFQAWLSTSEAHSRAYAQVRDTWSDFEDAADENELRALRAAALAAEPLPKPRRWAFGAAAGVVLGAACASTLWYALQKHAPPVAAAPSLGTTRYVTAHNQPTTVTLPDGSRVTLNLDTALESRLSDRERSIRLTRGQAFFEVAKDPRRPFVVTAADQRIQALGTKFDVRLDPHSVEIVLLEGRVSVDREAPSLLDKVMHRPAHVDLAPGERLIAAAGKAPVVSATDAARESSWREGWVVFEDESLGQVIAELNRYSDKPILATDQAVRQLRLSGVFRIGEPDRFGAVIQELLPVVAKPGVDGETILALKSSAAAQPP